MQGVEPAAGLVDRFGDEIGRKLYAIFHQFGVLEGIVLLSEGHGSSVEPGVDDLFDSAHGSFAALTTRPDKRVLGLGIDEGAMWVELLTVVDVVGKRLAGER